MKPKRGEDYDEMEEPAQDPLDLVKQLVLLIVEARTPDLSVKGRVEGPHCHVIGGGPPHHCSRDRRECFRAREFCRSAQQLWSNEIPICIDILLFPNCPCGWEEVKVTEGAVISMADENALLVERWMVVSEKRRHDSGLGSNLLLQAVRSYLHFSQISSWLYSEKGKLPNLLAYRIYAPGEESSLDFHMTPDTHAFPYCILRYDSIKVTVSAMRRVSQVPVLLCASENSELDKVMKNESTVKGELKLMDEYQERMNELKAGHPTCIDQMSHCHKRKTKGKYSLLKQKSRRETSKEDCLQDSNSYDIRDGTLGWNENLSVLLQSKMTYYCEGNYPRRKGGTEMDNVYRKEILKEHINGTEKARVFTWGVKKKSNDWTQEIWNPEMSHGKKDGEKDQRIEQMKSDETLVEGMEKAGSKILMNRKMSYDTESAKFLKNYDVDVSFLLTDKPAIQKEQFWTNFSKGFGSNLESSQAALASHLFCEEKEERLRFEKRMERTKNTECNKRSLRKFERDRQIQTLWEKPRSEMFSVDGIERKSYLSDSESYEEDFICRLPERMALDQNKPFIKAQSAETKALPFNLEHKSQDLKSRIDYDFHERRDYLNNCVRQHDTLRSAWQHFPKSTRIINVTETSTCGQNFRDMPDKEEKELSAECKEINACNTVKSMQPHHMQLSVDISCSDFEMEWDSDDTPTASPNDLTSSKASGSSLCKAVTSRQMIGATNNGTSNLDIEDMAERKYCSSPLFGQEFESGMLGKISPFRSGENEYGNSCATSALPNSRLKINIDNDASFYPSKETNPDEAKSILNKRTHSDNLSSRNDIMVTNHEVRPQGTSRKIFEENLLPLASYDVQTESFKMVDPNNQVKVLHSPKVLLSCDVPTEEAMSSEKGRCINFEEEVASELFISRLQEIMPSQGLPHGIGSYMSHLAAISSREKHKKEPDARGSDGTCQEENKVNELEGIENELNFVKDINVFETKVQTDKMLQYVVVRNETASDNEKHDGKQKQERDGIIDLEELNSFDQKGEFHNIDNPGDYNVEDAKEHTNISDNFSYSSAFIVHEHPDKRMETEFKKEDAESEIFKNLMVESGMNELKKVSRCLNLHPSGNKNEPQMGTNCKDRCRCQSDCELEPVDPYDTTLSDSDCSDLNPLSTIKDFSPAALSPVPTSFSSSSSSNLTNNNSLSSLHSLLSSPTSSNHSSLQVPSSLTALTSCKSHHYSNIENREYAYSKTFTGIGQIALLDTPTDDNPQFIHNVSTPDKENVSSLSSNRDKHSSIIMLTNGKPQLDKPSSSFTSSQRPYKCDDGITAINISALASLSLVDAENQPHSQELTSPASLTQVCPTGTKSSNHALIYTSGQRDGVECKSIDKQTNGISSNLNKIAIPHPNPVERSFSKGENYITSIDSSPEVTNNDTESALKVIPFKSTLDSEFCSRNSIDVINDICLFRNSAQRHPKLSSILNPKHLKSCGKVSRSQNCGNIDDIKGSNFSNLNAINTYLQASQSLSFQTICDNGGKSSTFHASANPTGNVSSSIGIDSKKLVSSTSIEIPKMVSSQLAEVEMQQVITKSNLDVHGCQNDIGKEYFCENKNKDSTSIASPSSERILKNHSKFNLPSSQARLGYDVSQFEMTGECQNLSNIHSTKVKAMNNLPLNNLYHKGTKYTSHTCGTDPEVCHLSGKKQYQIGHSFIEDKAKADAISHKEKASFSMLNCTQRGRSFEDNDDHEVFFYLDENAAPNVPKICSTSHSSSLATSPTFSSSSCVLLGTPFSSLSTVNTSKLSSLSTEAGMDLECSPNHDLDQGPFGRSRMSSYGDCLPGWTPNPPHRSVSTPDCAEGEVRGRGYQRSTCSRSTSVLQQSDKDGINARRAALMSSSMIFNSRTALPTQSSPAPLKRKSGSRFDYDASLFNVRAIKNAFSCSKLALGVSKEGDNNEDNARTLSTSAPASTNCLLGNFEESILNGRIDPVGTVDGFSAEIGASGSFCPKHLHLPVSAFFFALSDDNAPSPYLGHINLNAVSKKGYHIPKKGTVQVTLFNPNKTVVKMFVVMYDLSDMPASSQTFIRQRTMYIPTDKETTAPSYLRYLIHLRCSSSRSGKIYLHTDIRLIFARHKLDIDAKTVPYEMKSYTDVPRNPKYSPKK